MSDLRCLIVDYGGVLTNGIDEVVTSWLQADDLTTEVVASAMQELDAAEDKLSHALERGELSVAEFERLLAAHLGRADGRHISPDGLLRRMFAGLRAQSPMADVVRRAKKQGLQTALLSNSWGFEYDRTNWDVLFDAVVISGEVGLRKPEPEIYRFTAERLEVQPKNCVFVDDAEVNVQGAVAVGMVGVHHVDTARTAAELEILFGISLQSPGEKDHAP